MIPIAVLVAGVVVAGVVSRRLPADLASGIGAGLFGGWVAFTLRVALHGTPYGFGGLSSDAGRLAAMANTYSHTWYSATGSCGRCRRTTRRCSPGWWGAPPR